MQCHFLFSPEEGQGEGYSGDFASSAGRRKIFLTTAVPGDILKMKFNII
jgi:hypothetical protein